MAEADTRLNLSQALPGLERMATELFRDRSVPEVGLIRQRLDAPMLDGIGAAAETEVLRVIRASGLAPQRIAVGVGSRGIANLLEMVRATVNALKTAGFDPFIVPAMGSHGGATAEGQLEVLASYGVVEGNLGVPIRATMETVVIGEAGGLPVHFDRFAHEAGAVFLISRVKCHTDFRGSIESGPSKMSAIGLGKQAGARIIHSAGIPGLRDLMPAAARLAAAKGLLVGALAVVENQRDETARVQGLLGSEIGGPAEEKLLEEAKRLMPRIPFDLVDVLVIDRMGKDVSGTGMDSNVLNRMRIVGQPEPAGLQITNVVVLSLTEASHGNAVGIGLADLIPARLALQLDLRHLYTNGLTAGIVGVQRAKLPVVLPTDREAIVAAIATRGRPDSEPVRLAWIADTLHTETLAVSPALYAEAQARDDLVVEEPLEPMPFGADGSLSQLADRLGLAVVGGSHFQPGLEP
jgi:hypothetical protein